MRCSRRWLVAAFSGSLIVSAASAGTQLPVERCAGAICLRDPQLTEDAFVKRFGPGMLQTDADEPGLRRHCFFLHASSRWILFTFDHASTQRSSELVSVLISSIELCALRVPPKIDMGPMTLERGISLGQRRSDIERVLGPPHRTDQVDGGSDINHSPRLGRTRLVYEIESDTLLNFFCLDDAGSLSSILLSDSP